MALGILAAMRNMSSVTSQTSPLCILAIDTFLVHLKEIHTQNIDDMVEKIIVL